MDVLLENRGFFSASQKQDFLTAKTQSLHDPYLLKDMEKAVKRIRSALQKDERIIIYGDYDVDGISGTAVLVHALKKLNAKVSYRIPHRLDDGYGLHTKYIDEAQQAGVSLMITVDCGISCAKEMTYAKEKNIDIMITDHHSIPEIFPHDAYAILHPLQPGCGYPCKGLTGSAVAYKLAQALLINNAEEKSLADALIEFAGFGVVADLGPLVGENRTIVSRALESFYQTKWLGLEHLQKTAQIKPERHPCDTTVVGFQIAPRINAAGRIAHPYLALQLLLQEDPSKAAMLAAKLEELNNQRRAMTEKACQEAQAATIDSINEDIVIASSKDWHAGIIGLIAAKISEKYHRPAFIFSDRGDFLMASVRSPATFNVMDLMRPNGHVMSGFGGHAQAAGLSVTKENFPKLCELLKQEARKKPKDMSQPPLTIDTELKPEEATIETIEKIEQLHPFGIGNEQPLFALEDALVEQVQTVGKNREHLKASFRFGGKNLDAIAFFKGDRAGELDQKLRTKESIRIAGHLEKNTFNGKTKVQMRLVDFREMQK